MKVMVVDDTRTMRMIVTRALKNLEEVDEVVQAESAEQAIEMLMAEPVDLVLCDWNMPGMDGIELLEALRAAEWTVPFGFITAQGSEEARSRALGSGAAFLLTKPFTEEQLGAAIAGLGGGTAAPAGNAPAGLEGVGRAEALRVLFGTLCGCPVEVEPSEHGPALQAPRQVALYGEDATDPAAVLVIETGLGLAAAGAMKSLPASATRDWVQIGVVPDELASELHEVANVLARFMGSGGSPITLRAVESYAPGERIGAFDRSSASAEHFSVTIEGFDPGLCSVVAA